MSGQSYQNQISFQDSRVQGEKSGHVAASLLHRRARCSRWLVLLAGLALIGSLAGCNKPRGKIDRLYKVHGKVVFDKQPAVGATVVLHPQEGSFPPGINPTATTDKEGKFQINSYKPDDGAPVGGYVITVSWFKIIQAPSGVTPGPNVLPDSYAVPETSPVKLIVEPKELNEVPLIEIAAQ